MARFSFLNVHVIDAKRGDGVVFGAVAKHVLFILFCFVPPCEQVCDCGWSRTLFPGVEALWKLWAMEVARASWR